MSAPRVPLNELAAAVQNAVEQTLAKHGTVPIEKLWVGFVAPDKIATPGICPTSRECACQGSRCKGATVGGSTRRRRSGFGASPGSAASYYRANL